MKRITLTEGTQLQIEGFVLNDEKFIQIRKFYKKKGQTDWMPTKSGISLPADIEVLKKLIAHIKTEYGDRKNFKTIKPRSKTGTSDE